MLPESRKLVINKKVKEFADKLSHAPAPIRRRLLLDFQNSIAELIDAGDKNQDIIYGICKLLNDGHVKFQELPIMLRLWAAAHCAEELV